MRASLRFPFVVAAIAVGAAWSSPEDAQATMPGARATTTVVANRVQTLVVHAPTFVSTHSPCALRRRAHAQHDPELPDVTIDQTDPWTGAPPKPEVAAVRNTRPLDANDPWTGEPIPGFSAVALAPPTLDPWTDTREQ